MLDKLHFHEYRFMPDIKRVILQFSNYGDVSRKKRMIDKILRLTQEEVDDQIELMMEAFDHRHHQYRDILERNFQKIADLVPPETIVSSNRSLLLGAIFTNEYSYEAAAYMNPSLVIRPGASEGSHGDTACIMSMRAVGEGHISSIAFKELNIEQNGRIVIPESGSKSVLPEYIKDFESHTEIRFDPETKIAERVLFPASDEERNGVEDARFVAFEDGRYFATYTAYDGKNIRVKLLETKDFSNIILHRLTGEGVQNKGLALFPKRLAGKFAMIGRLDGENLYFLESENMLKWDKSKRIDVPLKPWETVQIGNCGSPLHTPEGWLLVTHGVGPMRTYYISAYLLDYKKPWQVLARMPYPLIDPLKTSREGYVPNVVYSCGSSIINEKLYLPFAVADYYAMIASIPVEDLLSAMKSI